MLVSRTVIRLLVALFGISRLCFSIPFTVSTRAISFLGIFGVLLSVPITVNAHILMGLVIKVSNFLLRPLYRTPFRLDLLGESIS